MEAIATAGCYKFAIAGSALTGHVPEAIINLLPSARFAKFENFLGGEKQGIDFKLFDYQDDGNKKYTVLAFNVQQTRALSPCFIVRPPHKYDSLKTLFSDFILLPGILPTEYTLLALKSEQVAVRQVMRAISIYKWPQLDLFAEITMCNGEWLLFYKPERLLSAEQESVERFLEIGADMASAVLYANREHYHHW
ncbi:MAG: hypothetical protein KDE51_15515 [Anaerolineales bacterium]|nr:hypothetical protein [Anaerolineales bacterium]